METEISVHEDYEGSDDNSLVNQKTSVVIRYGGAVTDYPEGIEGVQAGPKNTQEARLTYSVPPEEIKGVIVYVHSGGWFGGDRDEHEEIYKSLHEQGYATLSIGYRLSANPITGDSEGGDYPNSGLDVMQALNMALGYQDAKEGLLTEDEQAQWQTVRDFADRGLTVMGTSAGGHLAAWAATRMITENPDAADRIDAVVSIAGPQDLRSREGYDAGAWDAMVETYLGTPETPADQGLLNDMSPAHWVENHDAPYDKVQWFFVTAEQDAIVPHDTAVRPMADALRDRGANVGEYVIQGDIVGGHAASPALISTIYSLIPSFVIDAQRVSAERNAERDIGNQNDGLPPVQNDQVMALAHIDYDTGVGIVVEGIDPGTAFAQAAAGDIAVSLSAATPPLSTRTPEAGIDPGSAFAQAASGIVPESQAATQAPRITPRPGRDLGGMVEP